MIDDRSELETIILERSADGVATITLNRPDRGNGVVPELVRDFLTVLDACEADRSLRVLVLTGAGKVFCAGADLVAFKQYLDERIDEEEEPFNARVLFPVTQKVVACRFPIVAAVNGAATAGGLDLACACDLRIASSRAKVGETYIKLGLNPGNGGAYFLPRLVGSGLAAEMALTGDLYTAEQGLAMGLFNRIVEPEQLMEETVGLAARIARSPRWALEATKHQLRQSWHMDLQSAMNLSYWGVATMQRTADLREGIDAAIEKRAPDYNARDRA